MHSVIVNGRHFGAHNSSPREILNSDIVSEQKFVLK